MARLFLIQDSREQAGMDQAKLGQPRSPLQTLVLAAESCSGAGTKRGQPGAVLWLLGFALILTM